MLYIFADKMDIISFIKNKQTSPFAKNTKKTVFQRKRQNTVYTDQLALIYLTQRFSHHLNQSFNVFWTRKSGF